MKTRRGTLYTLAASEILAGDYHNLVRSNFRPVMTYEPNVAIAPMHTERFVVPIHHVVRCIEPKTKPLHTDPWLNQDREDFFFALEPALAEILNAPFVAKVEAAERRELAASSLLRMAEESVFRFNQMPWWKRGWFAIRQGVTF